MRRRLRTRSRKRVSERTPGGRAVLHYRTELGRGARCGRCGRRLGGIPRRWVDSGSGRTVSRLYGGVLCGGCVRELLKARVQTRVLAEKA